MVYIYALIGRLVLYPYLLYRAGHHLSGRACRYLLGYFALEFALSTLALGLHNFVMHPLMSFLMTLNIFVFFSTGYASLFVIAMHLRECLLGSKAKIGNARRGKMVFAIALGIFLVCGYIGYRNVAELRVNRQELRLTPEATRHLSLALATDIHIGEGITDTYVRRIVEAIQAQQPDLILIGGDYIDHFGKYAYEPQMMELMRRLSAPDGVYYVAGNHEYRADSLEKLNWVKEVGGILLRDSIVYPRGGAYALIGRDDFVQKSRASLASLTAQLKSRPLNILLEHTPEGLDSLAGSPIHLALYGHTHGGQIFPNQLTVFFKYGIASGKAHRGDTELFVSSGAGSAGAPYRIGTRSEIVIYDIYY